jgi:hypothetical protein
MDGRDNADPAYPLRDFAVHNAVRNSQRLAAALGAAGYRDHALGRQPRQCFIGSHGREFAFARLSVAVATGIGGHGGPG